MKKGVYKHRGAYKSSVVVNNIKREYCYIGVFTSQDKAHSSYLQLNELISDGIIPCDAVKLLDNKFDSPIKFNQQRIDSVDMELSNNSIYFSTYKEKLPAQVIGIELRHLDLLIESLMQIKNKLVLTE